ncbi:hypothetical protein M2161_008893 [Streptomyces sp. SAI-133]|jgi:hypothetical protein|uniref:hypothetical protein n=1 Tax=unclassified Streptomyces TaxID=2593676 RepID=UPI0024764F7E|nr:hypothetical protein [Streptomyces sp. SAI-133]MDH6589787.1 hypothetical protein [Streptomyces sp. SAI-133]
MSTQEPAIFSADELAEKVAELVHRYEAGQARQHEHAKSLEMRMRHAIMARKQWKAVEQGLPDLLVEVRDGGWEPKQIAKLFDLTESYVYRKLREHDAQQ